jgi:hypothetical protein
VDEARTDARSASDIEAYVVYRFRLLEYIHLFGLWTAIRTNRDLPEGVTRDYASTVRLAVEVWFHSFFDKDRRALNVFRLWPRLFPWRREQIEALHEEIKPQLDVLARFRHTTGAHASVSIKAHNEARNALKGPEFTKAFTRFLDLANDIARDEGKVPGLLQEILSYGLPPPL